MKVPFQESVYETLIGIAERIIRQAEEKLGGPARIISTEPLIAATTIGAELFTYNFDSDEVRKEAAGEQKTA